MTQDSTTTANQQRRNVRLRRARSIGWLLFLVINTALGIRLYYQYQEAVEYSVTVPEGMVAHYLSSEGDSRKLQAGITHTLPAAGEVTFYRPGPAHFEAQVQAVRDKGLLSWDKTRTVTAVLSGSVEIDEKLLNRTSVTGLKAAVSEAIFSALDSRFDDYDEKNIGELVIALAKDNFAERTGAEFSSLSVVSFSHSQEEHKAYKSVHFGEEVATVQPVVATLNHEKLYPSLAVLGAANFLLIFILGIFPEAFFPVAALSLLICPLAIADGARREAKGAAECCGCCDCDDAAPGGCCACAPECDGCGGCDGCDGCAGCDGCDCSCDC